MKPYFETDNATIYHGDNIATMQAVIPDASIDLVVTSPPYDNLRTYGGHSWDFEGLAEQLFRVTKPGGVVVWVVADATVDGSETGTSFRQALHFMEIGFRLHDTMIYKRSSPHPPNVRYWQEFEYMFVFSCGPPSTFNPKTQKKRGVYVNQGGVRAKNGTVTPLSDAGRQRIKAASVSDDRVASNVWDYGVANAGAEMLQMKHPATFPEALARDHILSWSNEGDLVLDPFSGSGTTAKMARLMGRKAIGIEVNQEYCDIAVERLRQRVLF